MKSIIKILELHLNTIKELNAKKSGYDQEQLAQAIKEFIKELKEYKAFYQMATQRDPYRKLLDDLSQAIRSLHMKNSLKNQLILQFNNFLQDINCSESHLRLNELQVTQTSAPKQDHFLDRRLHDQLMQQLKNEFSDKFDSGSNHLNVFYDFLKRDFEGLHDNPIEATKDQKKERNVPTWQFKLYEFFKKHHQQIIIFILVIILASVFLVYFSSKETKKPNAQEELKEQSRQVEPISPKLLEKFKYVDQKLPNENALKEDQELFSKMFYYQENKINIDVLGNDGKINNGKQTELLTLAENTRHPEMSLYKQAAALFRKNPQCFPEGFIALKENCIVALPTIEQALVEKEFFGQMLIYHKGVDPKIYLEVQKNDQCYQGFCFK